MEDNNLATQEMREGPEEAGIRTHIQDARLILLVGLANGFVIGTFFLIYIVLAIVFGEGSGFAPHAGT